MMLNIRISSISQGANAGLQAQLSALLRTCTRQPTGRTCAALGKGKDGHGDKTNKSSGSSKRVSSKDVERLKQLYGPLQYPSPSARGPAAGEADGIMRSIESATDWHELNDVFQTYANRLDSMHLYALLTGLRRVVDAYAYEPQPLQISFIQDLASGLAYAIQTGVEYYTVPQLAVLMECLVSLGIEPPPRWIAQAELAPLSLANMTPAAAAPALLSIAGCFIRCEHTPPRPWVQSLASLPLVTRVGGSVTYMPVRDVVSLARAVAVWGMQPPGDPWVTDFTDVVYYWLSRGPADSAMGASNNLAGEAFSVGELALILHALITLGTRPVTQEWVSLLIGSAQRQLDAITALAPGHDDSASAVPQSAYDPRLLTGLGELASLLTAFNLLQYDPGAGFVSSALEAAAGCSVAQVTFSTQAAVQQGSSALDGALSGDELPTVLWYCCQYPYSGQLPAAATQAAVSCAVIARQAMNAMASVPHSNTGSQGDHNVAPLGVGFTGKGLSFLLLGLIRLGGSPSQEWLQSWCAAALRLLQAPTRGSLGRQWVLGAFSAFTQIGVSMPPELALLMSGIVLQLPFEDSAEGGAGEGVDGVLPFDGGLEDLREVMEVLAVQPYRMPVTWAMRFLATLHAMRTTLLTTDLAKSLEVLSCFSNEAEEGVSLQYGAVPYSTDEAAKAALSWLYAAMYDLRSRGGVTDTRAVGGLAASFAMLASGLPGSTAAVSAGLSFLEEQTLSKPELCKDQPIVWVSLMQSFAEAKHSAGMQWWRTAEQSILSALDDATIPMEAVAAVLAACVQLEAVGASRPGRGWRDAVEAHAVALIRSCPTSIAEARKNATDMVRQELLQQRKAAAASAAADGSAIGSDAAPASGALDSPDKVGEEVRAASATDESSVDESELDSSALIKVSEVEQEMRSSLQRIIVQLAQPDVPVPQVVCAAVEEAVLTAVDQADASAAAAAASTAQADEAEADNNASTLSILAVQLFMVSGYKPSEAWLQRCFPLIVEAAAAGVLSTQIIAGTIQAAGVLGAKLGTSQSLMLLQAFNVAAKEGSQGQDATPPLQGFEGSDAHDAGAAMGGADPVTTEQLVSVLGGVVALGAPSQPLQSVLRELLEVLGPLAVDGEVSPVQALAIIRAVKVLRLHPSPSVVRALEHVLDGTSARLALEAAAGPSYAQSAAAAPAYAGSEGVVPSGRNQAVLAAAGDVLQGMSKEGLMQLVDAWPSMMLRMRSAALAHAALSQLQRLMPALATATAPEEASAPATNGTDPASSTDTAALTEFAPAVQQGMLELTPEDLALTVDTLSFAQRCAEGAAGVLSALRSDFDADEASGTNPDQVHDKADSAEAEELLEAVQRELVQARRGTGRTMSSSAVAVLQAEDVLLERQEVLLQQIVQQVTSLLQAIEPHLSLLPPSKLPSLLNTIARARHALSPQAADALTAQAGAALRSSGTQELVNTIAGFSQAGLPLPDAMLEAAVESSRAALLATANVSSRSVPIDVINSEGNGSTGSVSDARSSSSRAALPEALEPEQLVTLLGALGRQLNAEEKLDPAWEDAMWAAVQCSLKRFGVRQVAGVLQAAGVLARRPAPQLMQALLDQALLTYTQQPQAAPARSSSSSLPSSDGIMDLISLILTLDAHRFAPSPVWRQAARDMLVREGGMQAVGNAEVQARVAKVLTL